MTGAESATERDGFLSIPRERHALAIGLGATAVALAIYSPMPVVAVIGAALGIRGVERMPNDVLSQIRREPWYLIAGTLPYWLVRAVEMAPAI